MSACGCHDSETMKAFNLPEDGYFHIATPGEWPHAPTGLVQVLDDESMHAIIKAFEDRAKEPNWPGVLIDFDHQSLDQDKPTVAAGWIVALQKRDNGLWGHIRWSDLGRKSIEGGRYRFISPVWKSSDCDKLGDDRIRPLKLMNCAVTNDPNIKGLFPLSNATAHYPMRFTSPGMPIANVDARVRAAAGIGARAMEDDQRRAMWAAMGARGGGGGGGGGSGSSNPKPRQNPSPLTANMAESKGWDGKSSSGRDHESRIGDLERQKADIEAAYDPPPRRPHDFSQTDIKQLERDLWNRGVSPMEIQKQVNAAKAENARRKSEYGALEREAKRLYKSPESQERYIKRELDKREKAYDKEYASWQRKEANREKALRSVDQKIADEKIRKQESYENWQQDSREKAIKAQIEADKEAERQRKSAAAEARQTEADALRERNQPRIEARDERLAMKEYYEAIERGNMAQAEQLFPGANHAQVKGQMDRINYDYNPRSPSDVRSRKRYLEDLTSRLPPGYAPR